MMRHNLHDDPLDCVSVKKDIRQFLLSQFNPAAATGLDLGVGFSWQGNRVDEAGECQFAVAFAIDDGCIRPIESQHSQSRLDLTLFFASPALLQTIILGEADPMAHFLTGEFRTDGGLPLVFPTLRAFSGERP